MNQHTPLTRRDLFLSYPSGMVKQIINSSAVSILPYVDHSGMTPNADFYTPSGHDTPFVDVDHWRLRISGLVKTPLAMTLEDLQSLGFIERVLAIANIKSRPDQFLVGQAVWRGVPFMTLIEQSSVGSDAAYAALRSVNGYTTYLSLEMFEDAVLAFEMNGEQLSPQQGYPARLIVPGLYDYKLPKWLSNIEFTSSKPAGYFESRGWSATGAVQTTAMIFSPRVREQLGRQVMFNGIAFAGSRDIEQIELSIDDGEWMPVPFATVLPGQWTRWEINWTAPASGDYVVRVRATDTAQSQNEWSTPHSVVFRVGS